MLGHLAKEPTAALAEAGAGEGPFGHTKGFTTDFINELQTHALFEGLERRRDVEGGS